METTMESKRKEYRVIRNGDSLIIDTNFCLHPMDDSPTLRNDLMCILGAEHIYVHRYKIRFKKGSLFKWEDIEPKIIKIIEGIFGEKFHEVEKEKVKDDQN